MNNNPINKQKPKGKGGKMILSLKQVAKEIKAQLKADGIKARTSLSHGCLTAQVIVFVERNLVQKAKEIVKGMGYEQQDESLYINVQSI